MFFQSFIKRYKCNNKTLTNKFMEEINNKIKLLRKAHNLTQEEFAGHIEISRGHTASIEKGRFVPSKALMKRILEVFNLSINDFDLPDEEFVNKAKKTSSFVSYHVSNDKTKQSNEQTNDDKDLIIELLKDLNKMLKKEVDSLQKELQKTKNEISNN